MEANVKMRVFFGVVTLLALVGLAGGAFPVHAGTGPAGYVEHAKTETLANNTKVVHIWGWASLNDGPTNVAIYEYVNNSYVFLMNAYAGTARSGQPTVFSFDAVLPPLSPLAPGQTDHEIRVLEASTAAPLSIYYTASNFDKALQSGQIRVDGDPEEYALISTNQLIRVGFHKRYGGSITRLFNQDQGPINLVDDDQAGAMFQTAFWLYNAGWPTNSASHAPPPNCPNRNDMFFDNPTQAGYYGDGHAGNPIGVFGTSTTADTNEFIRYENGKLHLKTRLIRYDYCYPTAPMSSQSSWDTTFYLEQWAYFSPSQTSALVLDTTISNVGSMRTVSTRTLPVIFARNLPNLSRVQGSVLTSTVISVPSSGGITPDNKWTALTATSSGGAQKGMGLVINPNTTMLNSDQLFGYSSSMDGASAVYSLFPASGGSPNLSTMGLPSSNITLNSDATTYNFPVNSSFKWRTYYPIGTLTGAIKPTADTLLNAGNYSTYWTVNW